MILNRALDYGIAERDFWDMTIGEVLRAVESRNRVRQLEAQDKATYDYIQATLIVKGVAITLGSSSNFPGIEEAYPGIFDNIVDKKQEEKQRRKDELSVLRFKQFAQSYNKRYEGGAKE